MSEKVAKLIQGQVQSIQQIAPEKLYKHEKNEPQHAISRYTIKLTQITYLNIKAKITQFLRNDLRLSEDF